MCPESIDVFFSWLRESAEARALCGISDNGDGTYWIADLPLIESQPEETKAKLRAFLKTYGKKPKCKQVETPEQVVSKSGMSTEVRSRLDALYRQIDELRANAPAKKYLEK